MPKFSIIIPVYNRPDELSELLASLKEQSLRDFEVVVVEDGSTISSKGVVNDVCHQMTIIYTEHENSGPALSRNLGSTLASGQWLLFLDSDCVVPADFLKEVDRGLSDPTIDAFGGPDRAANDFTDIQKAINYSMTSFFTTGGIRGGVKSLEKFHPRSFNMGMSRAAFDTLAGFAPMRFGEDIDLSMRLMAAGYRCVLIADAWVYHKRRVDLRKFFRQVRASGGARVTLSALHPHSLRLVHILPALFLIFVVASVVGALFCLYALLPLALYMILVFLDANRSSGSVRIGALAVVSSIIQLIGYGYGFLSMLFNKKSNKISNKKFYN